LAIRTRLLLRAVLVLFIVLGDDVGPVGQVVDVIGEEVVLLAINDCFNNLSSLFSFSLEHSRDDVHYFGDHRWKPGEGPVYDALSHTLQHMVDVLK
jgi:hypothetical protein